MKTILKVIACLFVLGNASGAHAKNNKKPKLIVGIVVDQMRHDFLYRYASRYGNSGFKRLMQEGHVCKNAFINYLPSYTAPGHTCIYTGTVPSIHGIASNDWIDRASQKTVYCTADATVSNVGGTLKAGRMSPKNLWTTTIMDELRLATNFRSKTIAISVKDRASILPGGHTANAAYWMDDTLGVFMSSTYYMKDLPKYVLDFNNKNIAQTYMAAGWNTMYPINSYVESSSDDNAYEGKFRNETTTAFPHSLAGLKLADIKKTPFGNSILMDFAKEVLVAEKLGKGNETDFLSISFSSPDYVGHMYGPNSIETEDTYLRLDKEIASFLAFLDEEVGEGNYSLFLTADHGVAHNPQYLIDYKIPSGYMFGTELKKSLNDALALQFAGVNGLVLDVSENFVWMNDSLIKSLKLNKQSVVETALSILRAKEEMHYVIDMEHIATNIPVPQIIKQMAVNGYVHGRSGDILLLLKPSWLDAYSRTGTTHGTWNPYDTHIPLLWYGNGIKQGESLRHMEMTDIAATLATLLNIQMPNGCIGKPIVEVIE